MSAHPYCSSSKLHSHPCNIHSKPGHLVWVDSYSLWEHMRGAKPLEHRAALSQNMMLLLCPLCHECWDRQQAASPQDAPCCSLGRLDLACFPGACCVLMLCTVAVAWRMAQWRGEAWHGLLRDGQVTPAPPLPHCDQASCASSATAAGDKRPSCPQPKDKRRGNARKQKRRTMPAAKSLQPSLQRKA